MIFDTDILIYIARGVESAKSLLLETPDRAISTVSFMEYVPYCRDKKELNIFLKMLEALQFRIYEIDATVSLQARTWIRQFALSHSLEMGDALIAATAMSRNEVLCTSNDKHYKCISSLNLKQYRRR